MKSLRYFLLVATTALGVLPATAGHVMSPAHHGVGQIGSTAPVNTAIPEIVGEDFPSGGTTLTLSVNTGTWDNSPLSYACDWHFVGGSSLGTGCSGLTLNAATAGVIGSALEVAVTASNLAGSSTVTSHWFGPIEQSAPVAQVKYETLGTVGPSSLPTAAEYAHFLQNGHAIVPGCDIPPAAPNLTPSNVWYFDPINGTTQTQQTAAGVATINQGHAGHPFKDVSALWNGGTGYVGVLFGHGLTIPPGATIYIEPGDATHPVGSLATGAAMYSTADGTATGTTVFTWIMGDPAAASTPILSTIHNQNGANGLLFKNLRLEPAAVGTNSATIGSVGSAATPSHNMIYEDIRASSWINHSDDPWYPSNYPSTGGQSDGTVVTASPAIPQAGSQDPTVIAVTMAVGATSFTSASAGSFLVGEYVWSPTYYRSQTDSIWTAPSGIPNGTKVVSVVGTTVQLGPCDPVADAATGCPTTNYPGLSSNIPGCDPQVILNGVKSGGCPAGTPPAWTGATRALSGEAISFTPQMVVLPAGYFSNGDWGTALSDAFDFGGGLDTADSKDPSNPNLFVGSDCISVKDSVVRDVRNAFAFTNTHDSIAYNNKVKWTSGDMFDLYSTNRVWVVHNYGSDPTQIWDHQDGVQLGDSNGTVAIKYLYGNAVFEDELFQATDPTNWFPRSMQGINTTENNHWGDYVVDNTVVATTGGNGIQILGRYNEVAHNDMFGGRINVGHQTKGAALPSPIGSMLANNIGNGVTRDFSVTSFCDPVAGDLDVVKTNLSIPFIPLSGASEAYCDLTGVGFSGATPGFFQGVASWTLTDWQSQDAGISPLFTAYHPLTPPVAPAPGAGLFPQPIITPCVQGSLFPFITTCAPTAFGTLNLRPNTGFSGTTGTIALNVTFPQNLPSGQPDGTLAVVATSVGSASSGVWQACAACSLSTNGTTIHWTFVSANYNPGIIGGGTNLGAQQPIADHAGNAWNNPPSIGAYEQAAAPPVVNQAFSLPTGDVVHYADPSGSDSNDGLAPTTGGGHGPWLIATNHALKCGDVVIAAAGSYPQQGPSGTVSNCPSTTGGIDGTGGIYFATVLCGGASVGDCQITTKLQITGVTDAVFINTSNWAMEGWYCNPSLATGAGGVPKGRCYESNASGVILHHIAFVNDISADSLQAADTDDNGQPGAVGVDYFSVVGVIAQNSAQDPICLAAIDVVGPGVSDTNAGTHFYINGNFSYANANVGCRSNSDTEDYMADTWDRHNVSSQGVYSNNIGYSADRNCIQVFEQTNSTSTPTIKLYNNTCYKNDLNTGSDNSDAEINLNSTTNPMLWRVTIQNNLAYQPLATSSGGHVVYAFEVAQLNSTLTNGGSGAQNFFLGAATGCPGNAACDSGTAPVSAAAFTPATSGELGTNTYTNPAYTNTTDLLANQQGVPNCSGFENTTQCMGWRATTGTLTMPSVISDLVPTASGTSGKGYQLPSVACVTTGPVASDYPAYLKGIVYLHWNAATSTITENAGLVTKPCGM